jgi:hypothetical protein
LEDSSELSLEKEKITAPELELQNDNEAYLASYPESRVLNNGKILQQRKSNDERLSSEITVLSKDERNQSVGTQGITSEALEAQLALERE